MKAMKKLIVAIAACASIPGLAAVPIVSNVHMSQPSGTREVTITYNLDAAAVVTLDVQTNATANAAVDDPGWTSIGGEAVWNAWGDVWKEVNAEGNASFSGTIKWRPDLSWPGKKILGHGARAKLTAWSLDNTPDYMVVDLTLDKAQDGFITYFPGVDFLPKSGYDQDGAAVTNNTAYKTTKLLMRKIMAAGVRWTMGSVDESGRGSNETTHGVTLTNNYYIGVFEVTQAQYKNIKNSTPANFQVDGGMRPVEKVKYADIRGNATYNWPADPNTSSFLGMLRDKTGLDFDLPSEAQWEFAARAGNGSGYWNDGSAYLDQYTDANLGKLGRYKENNPGGTSNATTLAPSDGGTAIVGSYAPSDWGLYDMHGNVAEWCLDWYAADITGIDGRVNIDPATPANTLSSTLSGNPAAGASRVVRGGKFQIAAGRCRSAWRSGRAPGENYIDVWGDLGFRVVCRAGLQ